MEKSIEFLMTANEEHRLLDFIKCNSDIVMLSAASPNCSPLVIGEFYKEGENIFWDKIYIANRKDIGKIKMSFIKSCNHYIIDDTFEAPVIEIRKSRNNCRGNARIWCSLYYFNGCNTVYKKEEFENMYKIIETWIKINCNIISSISKYYA